MTPQQIGRKAYWQGAPLKACPFPKKHMAARIAWGGGWMAEHDADGGIHAMQHGMARDLQEAGHCEDEAFEMVGLPRAETSKERAGQLTKQRGSCKVVVYHNQRQCSTDTSARKREDNQQ